MREARLQEPGGAAPSGVQRRSPFGGPGGEVPEKSVTY